MHMLKILSRNILFSLAFCGSATGAQAAVITNLSDKPQVIEMLVSTGFQPVTIAAGETWRTPGKAHIRFHSYDHMMDKDEEFAIWQNGDFGPQRHLTNSKGNTSE